MTSRKFFNLLLSQMKSQKDKQKTVYYENYPLSIVILENLTSLTLYILGTIILSGFSMIIGAGYFIFCLISVAIIWFLVCPFCYYYGKVCPCGYGKFAPFLVKEGDKKKFKKQFKYLVIFSTFSFGLPVIGGLFLLIKNYTLLLLIELSIFAIIAFWIIPLQAKKISCKHCKQRSECPWG